MDAVTKKPAPAKNKFPFVYTTPVVASLVAGASTTVIVTFDQDSTFEWVKSIYFVDLNAAAMTDSARPIPLITVQIADTASGRNLNSAPVPIDSMAGFKAGQPYMQDISRLISPNSTLRFTFQNYSTATTYTNLYFTLHGIKTYK